MTCEACPDTGRCDFLGLCQHVAQVQLPGPEPVGEAGRGFTMKNGTKVYCCYGMFADVGHSDDCRHARRKGGPS